jgi:hypothetical protein
MRLALPEQPEPEEEPEAEEAGSKPAIASIKASLESGLLGPRATMAAKDALENHRDDPSYLTDIAARLKAAIAQRKTMQ